MERGDGTYDSTSLFLYIHKPAFIAGTIQYTIHVHKQEPWHCCTAVQQRETGLHRAPPELWPQLGTEEVRGPSSEAVSAGVADTAADSAAVSAAVSAGAADSAVVEMLVAPPVPGVQKPPRWVGERFRDRFAATAYV